MRICLAVLAALLSAPLSATAQLFIYKETSEIYTAVDALDGIAGGRMTVH